MKFTENLLKLLPFGYSFLVILGIIKQSVLYYQLGLNVLHYSTIMDILISPIADLTSHPIVLITVFTFILVIYFSVLYLSKNYKKNWVRKSFNIKDSMSELTEDEVKGKFGNLFLAYFAIALIAFYLGMGIGNGTKISKRIAENDLKYDHLLTYNSNETREIYLIGSNSANYFYVEKGNKNVTISPVVSIRSLEFLNNKKNKK